VPYNDLEAARKITEQFADDIACILIEPVAANMGVIPPAEGFLEGLRKLCDSINALLIFDEVITGFRVAPGGAQEKYGIQADLTTLGKIIGGGLPVGAFGGRTEIMKFLAPDGPVYQAGTLSGNPVVASAGIAVLNTLIETDPYEELDRLAGLLEMKLKEAFEDVSLPVRINRVGSMLTVFFCENPVSNYSSARTADTSRYASFFRAMQKSGILFPPSQFEAAFLSTAHAIRDIEKTITPLKKWLQKHKN
jgi:glutamate-1-semialdehyde 2,1-aminomutase